MLGRVGLSAWAAAPEANEALFGLLPGAARKPNPIQCQAAATGRAKRLHGLDCPSSTQAHPPCRLSSSTRTAPSLSAVCLSLWFSLACKLAYFVHRRCGPPSISSPSIAHPGCPVVRSGMLSIRVYPHLYSSIAGIGATFILLREVLTTQVSIPVLNAPLVPPNHVCRDRWRHVLASQSGPCPPRPAGRSTSHFRRRTRTRHSYVCVQCCTTTVPME